MGGAGEERGRERVMLTPEYFYGKSDRLVELYQELEDWILQDIAMRLLKNGEISGTADRELWRLQQLGLHNDEIVKRISKLSGLSQKEVRRILRDSVMTSFSDDEGVLKTLGSVTPPLQNNAVVVAMNVEMQKTFGELDNLTRTTMLQSQKDLLNLLNEVDLRVATGFQSYSSAVCEVLDRYAQNGVKIDYPKGATRSLEAAVRCCVVTSMNQTAAQVTNQYIAQGGIEYVLVSAHMGARHDDKHPNDLRSHDHWQGKVYKIVGRTDEIGNLLEETGYTIDPNNGQGTVVNPLGLHGYNCRHSHKPWNPALRNPYIDADGKPKIDIHESQELYKRQQEQRRMERDIRKTKRELLMKKTEIDGVAETDVKKMLQPQYDMLAYKLRAQNQAYEHYCKEHNLQTQTERLKVVGFKKKQASVANGRATVYQNQVKNFENGSKGVTINFTRSNQKQSTKESILRVNPKYGTHEAFSTNCQRCVPAFEMRERGYNVTAKGKYLNYDPLTNDYTLAWENPVKIVCTNGNGRAELEKRMAEYGDGARAEVRVKWKDMEEGHVFAAVQEHGKTVYYDPQPGYENCEEYFDYVEDGCTSFVRIDNLEPSALIYECCEEAGR